MHTTRHRFPRPSALAGEILKDLLLRLGDRPLHLRFRDGKPLEAGFYITDEADPDHVIDVRVAPKGIEIYKLRPDPEPEADVGTLWTDGDLAALEALKAAFGDMSPWIAVTEPRERRRIRAQPSWVTDPAHRRAAVEMAVDAIEIFVRPLGDLGLCPGTATAHLHPVRGRWQDGLCWRCAAKARPPSDTDAPEK